jgi:hypothetical protein
MTAGDEFVSLGNCEEFLEDYVACRLRWFLQSTTKSAGEELIEI